MYTQLGVLTKGTVIEVNVSELGMVTAGGKVVFGKYAQITNNPENDGCINAVLRKFLLVNSEDICSKHEQWYNLYCTLLYTFFALYPSLHVYSYSLLFGCLFSRLSLPIYTRKRP